MAIQVTGQSQGLVQSISQKSGTPNALSSGWHNELLVTELLPRYSGLALAGVVYYAAHTAQQALSLTGTTTYTGLVVANPSNSGKNLLMLDVAFSLGTLQTGLGAVALFFGASSPALTTGNTTGPKGTSSILGNASASVANVGASCTLAANPSVVRSLAGTQWVTTGTTSNIQNVKDEIAGALVVPPGQLIGIVAVTTAVTGVAHFTWAELPV